MPFCYFAQWPECPQFSKFKIRGLSTGTHLGTICQSIWLNSWLKWKLDQSVNLFVSTFARERYTFAQHPEKVILKFGFGRDMLLRIWKWTPTDINLKKKKKLTHSYTNLPNFGLKSAEFWPKVIIFLNILAFYKGSLGKSILQVQDTGTRVLANTGPFLHSSIVSF